MWTKRAAVVDVRTYSTTASEMARRAERRILSRRRAAVADDVKAWLACERDTRVSVFEEDCPFYPLNLDGSERYRLDKTAKKLVDRRAPATALPAKISKDEKEALVELSRSSVAVYASLSDVDEVCAQLHEEFPWLGRLTEVAWRQARLFAEEGYCVKVAPLVALGPPGVGKSTWARRLADLFGIPAVEVDVGATGGAFEAQGSDHRWGGGSPGRLVNTLLSTRIANPLVVLDELDAGSQHVGTSGGTRLTGLYSALLGMLEPTTSARWTCPYYSVAFDLRQTSWIFTCNSLSGIPPALISRVRIVEVDTLKIQDIRKFCSMRGVEMGLDGDVVESCADMLERRMREGRPTDLRTASRALDLVRERLNRPLLQ